MTHTFPINRASLCPVLFFLTSFIFIATMPAKSLVVKNLNAQYSKGQVFLTWTNVKSTNLQYNVYRSQSKFTNLSQLNSFTYLGFVRDSSSKNFRISLLDGSSIYYKFKNKGNRVRPGKGLYAVTCTDDASYYYAVMVVDLSSGIESKIINDGENSLSLAISETVEKPQPVLQDSIITPDGEIKYRYVQFVNNQETPWYPAMNSTGSYGFNFYIVKSTSSADRYPLMVLYQVDDLAASAKVDADYKDYYLLGVDDWLPIKFGDGKFSDDTYWCCYHQSFNIYTDQNPLPEYGIIKTYTQKRIIEAIRWTHHHFPVDSARVYLRGSSHNGFGALFTATLYPEEIAAVYGVVEPVAIGPNDREILEQMWGLGSSDLNSDVLNWETGEPIPFNKLSNLRQMLQINEQRSVPLYFDVHGKNDKTNVWSSGKVDWLDDLNSNHYGGTWYWDQREHGGDGKNFTADETLPAFLRYSTTKSYPAFTNCSVNHDPGNGSKTDGDPYGAYNGYLDFEDNIIDEECMYEVTVFVKDYYVGGVLDPEQYNTCKTDIAFRRLQNFNPGIGTVVKWENYNSSGNVIQSGSFPSNGKLMVIPELTIKKSGNRIQLTIPDCLRHETLPTGSNKEVDFIKTSNGYNAVIFSDNGETVTMNVYDMMGRRIFQKSVSLLSGSNTIEIPSHGNGIYLVEIGGRHFSVARKLFF